MGALSPPIKPRSELPGCEHSFSYAGLVWHFDKYPMPGSGAHEVYYEDRYFCQRCLEIRDINPRVQGNSYEKRVEGSIPK